jgi:predicted signal transduction protein with EAL and GGDEF domain
VRISVDDFGTSYSSLSYLGFPFDDEDRPVVRARSGLRPSQAIVRSIVSLGRPGVCHHRRRVETEAELSCLRAESALKDRALPVQPRARPNAEIVSCLQARADQFVPPARGAGRKRRAGGLGLSRKD